MFQSFAIKADENEDQEVLNFRDAPDKFSPLMRNISTQEVKKTIQNVHDKKAPGYDIIPGNIFKELA